MGLLKDVSQSVLRYGEIVLNRTEKLTNAARIKIEIKKSEYEIEKLKTSIGNYILNLYEEKSSQLSFGDSFLKQCIADVEILKIRISELNRKLSEAPENSSEHEDAAPGETGDNPPEN